MQTVDVTRNTGRKYEVAYVAGKCNSNAKHEIRQHFYNLRSEIERIEQYTYSKFNTLSNTRHFTCSQAAS